MKCEICGKLASFHLTETNNGVRSDMHLCDFHGAQKTSITIKFEPSLDSDVAAAASQPEQDMRFLKWLRERYQSTGKLPTVEEMLATDILPAGMSDWLQNEVMREELVARFARIAKSTFPLE